MMANDTNDHVKFRMREERLDIKKDRIKTAEIKCYREIITEEKTYTIPVKREELVIEKYSLDDGLSPSRSPAETVRIPLREEQVEINKKILDKEQVAIFMRPVEQSETVDIFLKKEVLRTKKNGKTGFNQDW